jgi:hypothetical protein
VMSVIADWPHPPAGRGAGGSTRRPLATWHSSCTPTSILPAGGRQQTSSYGLVELRVELGVEQSPSVFLHPGNAVHRAMYPDGRTSRRLILWCTRRIDGHRIQIHSNREIRRWVLARSIRRRRSDGYHLGISFAATEQECRWVRESTSPTNRAGDLR